MSLVVKDGVPNAARRSHRRTGVEARHSGGTVWSRGDRGEGDRRHRLRILIVHMNMTSILIEIIELWSQREIGLTMTHFLAD